jgi:D-apionolactonase
VIVSGTDANFCELNRARAVLPELAAEVDGLSFSANPQVHAFDNASLVETLMSFTAAVTTLHALAPNKPISITPITFKLRWNPYATVAPVPTPVGDLPTQVDVRQMSLFGAVWTLGCVAGLVANGIESATFYETTGWCGVMDVSAGSPNVTPHFYTAPDMTFPLYHVLADVGEMAGGEAYALQSSDPLRVTGLLLRKAGKTRVLIGNLTPETILCDIPPLEQSVHMRVLDETTYELAARQPAQFREIGVRVAAHTTSIEVKPYGVVCLTG